MHMYALFLLGYIVGLMMEFLYRLEAGAFWFGGVVLLAMQGIEKLATAWIKKAEDKRFTKHMAAIEERDKPKPPPTNVPVSGPALSAAARMQKALPAAPTTPEEKKAA